jgi:hypothetical protein
VKADVRDNIDSALAQLLPPNKWILREQTAVAAPVYSIGHCSPTRSVYKICVMVKVRGKRN